MMSKIDRLKFTLWASYITVSPSSSPDLKMDGLWNNGLQTSPSVNNTMDVDRQNTRI
jgi:hypothetical protein